MGSLSLVHAALTDRGEVRSRNEDALRSVPDRGLFVVADGMGGHPAGDVASAVAVSGFVERAREIPPEADRQEIREGLRDAMAAASRQLHEAASEDPGRRGMGTTLTALHLADGGWRVAHVGDSRAYLSRAGELRLLTTDHVVFPGSSTLTRAIGAGGEAEPDLEEGRLEDGDVFLLCSDGLTKTHSREEIAERLAGAGEDLEETADLLVREAKARGAPDNVTVVVVRARTAAQ